MYTFFIYWSRFIQHETKPGVASGSTSCGPKQASFITLDFTKSDQPFTFKSTFRSKIQEQFSQRSWLDEWRTKTENIFKTCLKESLSVFVCYERTSPWSNLMAARTTLMLLYDCTDGRTEVKTKKSCMKKSCIWIEVKMKNHVRKINMYEKSYV